MHNLDVLLHLSGVEEEIKQEQMSDWSNVKNWNPENRYKTISLVSKEEAEMMLSSVKELMKVL